MEAVEGEPEQTLYEFAADKRQGVNGEEIEYSEPSVES